MIKVLVAGAQAEEKDSIIEALAHVEYISTTDGAETAEQALEMLEQRHVDVVMVNAYMPGNGYKLTETIAEQYPEVAVIIIERELKEHTMRAALFAGARDVLIYPFDPGKLVDAIYRSHHGLRKKRLEQRTRPRGRKRGGYGQIITVFGTKGGVGKTFVATNLAVALAENKENRVALVDLDLDFGNAALALNIMPHFTIADVVNDVANLDQDLLESYLIPHRSGVKLLAANAEPQMTEFVNADYVGMILRILKDAFDYVIIDMPARFYDPVNPALQEADTLLLVATPEVVTLRNIKSCLTTLNMLKFPSHRIEVLLNKVESRSEIKLKDVEVTLNTRIYTSLPADYSLVTSSMNQGIPVVNLAPRSKISRGFHELAKKIGEARKAGKVSEKEAESEAVFQEVSNR